MKLIMQNLRDGKTYIEELPHPSAKKHHCVIRSHCSLVSPGTEKMLIRFGQAGWIDKVRQQPDKVYQVLEKVKHEGLMSAMEAVQRKIDQPVALGYSNVGTIVETGPGVMQFKVGDRVVSNGYHADFNVISENLMCRIPDRVSDETASFTMLAAIALQGIRLIQAEIGERIVVMGLGLIGQLACRILIANGCKVYGLDPSPEARAKAESYGVLCMDNVDFDGEALFRHVFDGKGADAVLITASSDQALINDAAKICRQRGRVVLVGVVANQLSRDLFYKKEIRFQVACSYGPGRYDPQYEEEAIDYPYGFVRWTEKRNMEAVLELMESGRLRTDDLVQAKVDFEQAIVQFYRHPEQLKWGNLICYPRESNTNIRSVLTFPGKSFKSDKAFTIGYFGSGAFSASTLLPVLKKLNANLDTLCSGGTDAARLARKFGFAKLSSRADEIWNNPSIDFVFVANRHQHHAAYVLEALRRGKHVFVEKPLAITRHELNDIRNALNGNCRLVVGYNRAYSSHIHKMRSHTDPFRDRLNIQYQINAGYLAATHWLHQPEQGGGRLIGELCHFVDLCNVLTGSEVVSVEAESMGMAEAALSDNVSVLLKYANGSLATIQYFSNGPVSYQKETLQVFFASKMLELNNFRSLKAYGLRMGGSLWPAYDKGHLALCKEALSPETEAFGESYIHRILHTSEICFQIVERLQGVDRKEGNV